MEGPSEVAAVRAALAAGGSPSPTPRPASTTRCTPSARDGAHAPVRRVVRGARGAITQVTARCPRCGAEVAAAPEELHLR